MTLATAFKDQMNHLITLIIFKDLMNRSMTLATAFKDHLIDMKLKATSMKKNIGTQ